VQELQRRIEERRRRAQKGRKGKERKRRPIVKGEEVSSMGKFEPEDRRKTSSD
jgi:hypothetical protein